MQIGHDLTCEVGAFIKLLHAGILILQLLLSNVLELLGVLPDASHNTVYCLDVVHDVINSTAVCAATAAVDSVVESVGTVSKDAVDKSEETGAAGCHSKHACQHDQHAYNTLDGQAALKEQAAGSSNDKDRYQSAVIDSQAWPDLPAFTHLSVNFLSTLYLITIRSSTDRLITYQLAVLDNRMNVGINPVEAAILGPVLYDAHEWLLMLEALPHDVKDLSRHVRMTDHIVRLSYELFAGKTTDFNKGIVYFGNDAIEISNGNDSGGAVIRKSVLGIVYWSVISHGSVSVERGGAGRNQGADNSGTEYQ